jgi:small-conductance mechanosensitive channel
MNIDLHLLFFGNTVAQYLLALAAFAVALVAFSILERVILTHLARLAEKTETVIDDAVIAMLRSVHPSFYWVISFYIGVKTLAMPHLASVIIDGIVLAWALYQAIRAASIAIDMLLAGKGGTRAGERGARNALAGIAKASLWVVAALLFLSNLGFNVTSLIAGLGIGGIAVAFALQNILADLFSSFAIYLDKPFEVGDFIIVGNQLGTVAQIGIKTTRLTALQGEEIVLSNRELTSTNIQNFKKMKERRVQMDFGITYETPRETLATLSGKIRAAIEATGPIRVDRVHFAGFGSSSLDFQLVYYVASADYNEYMDRQQALNLALVELFEREKVSFAYPTRMVYTAKT